MGELSDMLVNDTTAAVFSGAPFVRFQTGKRLAIIGIGAMAESIWTSWGESETQLLLGRMLHMARRARHGTASR